jgi:hypothetical protein
MSSDASLNFALPIYALAAVVLMAGILIATWRTLRDKPPRD